MSCVIVIPARMASTRFPGKPLAKIRGKTMLERVYEIAVSSGSADVVIATDDEALRDFALSFGATVVMTGECLTGTDRVAQASYQLDQYEIFFSLQGDAVLTPPWVIQEVLDVMKTSPGVSIATPAVLLEGQALSDFVESKKKGSSTGTSVVFNKSFDALYFSKSLIPFSRAGGGSIYRHIGLYAYRKEVLRRLNALEESPLERCEKLEQLRALENNLPIRVVPVDYKGRTHASVDSPEDVQVVESLIEREGELVLKNSITTQNNSIHIN